MKRVITVEVEVPASGNADYKHFVLTANPWDVIQHGNVVADNLEEEEEE